MDWEELLAQAESSLEARRHHEALQLCDRAAQASEDARYHAALLRGDVLLDLGDAAAALSSYESVADPQVPDPDVDCARGAALFELCMLPEADNALRSALRGCPDMAEAYYTLALVAELAGTGEEVELFRRARRLNPSRFPARAYLPRAEFEAVVAAALSALPDPVRGVIANIPVLVAEVPHPDDLCRSDPPMSPTTLGLFAGVPPAQQSVLDPPATEPAAILLFKRNLERAFPEREVLIEEIKRTVIHEVGHALGLSEEELVERGLE